VQTPPGWYRDPHRPEVERWWDGAAWTDAARPAATAVGASPTHAARAAGARTRELAAVTAVVLVIVALVVGALVAGRGSSAPPSAMRTSVVGPPATVPTSGTDFVESSGTYTLRIGDAWDSVELPSGAAWYTGTGSREFRDNVTVIVEDLPRRVSLADYVHISTENARRIGLLFDTDTRADVVLSDGRDGVVIDYSSDQRGFSLRHRVVITVHDLVAVTATFTSEDSRFDDSIRDVDAFLRTLSVR
jgi:hypothetical protein